jgi:hypothetical protein
MEEILSLMVTCFFLNGLFDAASTGSKYGDKKLLANLQRGSVRGEDHLYPNDTEVNTSAELGAIQASMALRKILDHVQANAARVCQAFQGEVWTLA